MSSSRFLDIKSQIEALEDTFNTKPNTIAATSLRTTVYDRVTRQKLSELTKILNGAPETLAANLNTFLQNHWNAVKGTFLSYTSLPNSELTKACCLIANYLSNISSEQTPALNFLMPTIKFYENFVSGDDIRQMPLEDILRNHISSNDNFSLLPVNSFAFINMESNLDDMLINPFVLLESGQLAPLTINERRRLLHHSPELEDVITSKNNYDREVSTGNTLLLAVKKLIAGLRKGGESGLAGGDSGSAGPAAYQAKEDFRAYWSLIPEAKKNEVYAANPDMKELIEDRVCNPYDQDCVEILAKDLYSYIERPDIRAQFINISLGEDQLNTLLNAYNNHFEVAKTAFTQVVNEIDYSGRDNLALSLDQTKNLVTMNSVKSPDDVLLIIKDLSVGEILQLCGQNKEIIANAVHDIRGLINILLALKPNQVKAFMVSIQDFLDKSIELSPSYLANGINLLSNDSAAAFFSVLMNVKEFDYDFEGGKELSDSKLTLLLDLWANNQIMVSKAGEARIAMILAGKKGEIEEFIKQPDIAEKIKYFISNNHSKSHLLDSPQPVLDAMYSTFGKEYFSAWFKDTSERFLVITAQALLSFPEATKDFLMPLLQSANVSDTQNIKDKVIIFNNPEQVINLLNLFDHPQDRFTLFTKLDFKQFIHEMPKQFSMENIEKLSALMPENRREEVKKFFFQNALGNIKGLIMLLAGMETSAAQTYLQSIESGKVLPDFSLEKPVVYHDYDDTNVINVDDFNNLTDDLARPLLRIMANQDLLSLINLGNVAFTENKLGIFNEIISQKLMDPDTLLQLQGRIEKLNDLNYRGLNDKTLQLVTQALGIEFVTRLIYKSLKSEKEFNQLMGDDTSNPTQALTSLLQQLPPVLKNAFVQHLLQQDIHNESFQQSELNQFINDIQYNNDLIMFLSLFENSDDRLNVLNKYKIFDQNSLSAENIADIAALFPDRVDQIQNQLDNVRILKEPSSHSSEEFKEALMSFGSNPGFEFLLKQTSDQFTMGSNIAKVISFADLLKMDSKSISGLYELISYSQFKNQYLKNEVNDSNIDAFIKTFPLKIVSTFILYLSREHDRYAKKADFDYQSTLSKYLISAEPDVIRKIVSGLGDSEKAEIYKLTNFIDVNLENASIQTDAAPANLKNSTDAEVTFSKIDNTLSNSAKLTSSDNSFEQSYERSYSPPISTYDSTDDDQDEDSDDDTDEEEKTRMAKLKLAKDPLLRELNYMGPHLLGLVKSKYITVVEGLDLNPREIENLSNPKLIELIPDIVTFDELKALTEEQFNTLTKVYASNIPELIEKEIISFGDIKDFSANEVDLTIIFKRAINNRSISIQDVKDTAADEKFSLLIPLFKNSHFAKLITDGELQLSDIRNLSDAQLHLAAELKVRDLYNIAESADSKAALNRVLTPIQCDVLAARLKAIGEEFNVGNKQGLFANNDQAIVAKQLMLIEQFDPIARTESGGGATSLGAQQEKFEIYIITELEKIFNTIKPSSDVRKIVDRIKDTLSDYQPFKGLIKQHFSAKSTIPEIQQSLSQIGEELVSKQIKINSFKRH